MTMKLNSILSYAIILFLSFFVFQPKSIHANEGQFELQSSLNNDSQCLAYSVEVQTNKYSLLITCRGLVYPPLPPNTNSYILWADGADTKNPTKLTNLLFGKGSAKKDGKFNRLFVTLERGDPKQPTGPTIMSSTIQEFTFSKPIVSQSDPNVQITGPSTSPIATPTPIVTKQPFWQTGLGKLIIIITGGFIIFVFILMVYGKRK